MMPQPESSTPQQCPACRGARVIGTPGVPCPFCKLWATPQPPERDSPAPADPFKLDPLERIIDEYLEDYELHGDDGDHRPTERERFVIKDAILGLLADPEWDAEWGAHIKSLSPPPASTAEPLELPLLPSFDSLHEAISSFSEERKAHEKYRKRWAIMALVRTMLEDYAREAVHAALKPSGDEREAFEKWAVKDGFGVDRDSTGRYESDGCADAWDVWQARAALGREQERAGAVAGECDRVLAALNHARLYLSDERLAEVDAGLRRAALAAQPPAAAKDGETKR